MFLPTNESFIRSSVEGTIDRHMGETEEERIIRVGQPYHPRCLLCVGLKVLHFIGHLLLGLGNRLEHVEWSRTSAVHHHPA